MKIPEPNISIANLIDKKAEEGQEAPRAHLGASLLGHPCDRYLWLMFRWAVIEKFDGRILRLFQRGQREEAEKTFFQKKERTQKSISHLSVNFYHARRLH